MANYWQFFTWFAWASCRLSPIEHHVCGYHIKRTEQMGTGFFSRSIFWYHFCNKWMRVDDFCKANAKHYKISSHQCFKIDELRVVLKIKCDTLLTMQIDCESRNCATSKHSGIVLRKFCPKEKISCIASFVLRVKMTIFQILRQYIGMVK